MIKVSSSDIGKPKYKLEHPEKYIGDPKNVIIRSSWEQRVFQFCDNNPNVLRWSSEEFSIPYMKPCPDGFKPAKYYPDLYVEYRNKHNELCKELIEVKPKKFTRASKSRNPYTKMFENVTYVTNMAKFQAAENWCKENGIKFRVLSEDSVFK